MNIKMETMNQIGSIPMWLAKGIGKKNNYTIMPFYLIFSGTGGLPINVTDTLAQ